MVPEDINAIVVYSEINMKISQSWQEEQLINNNNNNNRRGGVRQINTFRQIPLQFNLKKRRPLGFGVFIAIWSMKIRPWV